MSETVLLPAGARPTELSITTIENSQRIRKEYGDIAALAASIKDVGLIQPIVLAHDINNFQPKLLAGGRRLAALKALGYTTLKHRNADGTGEFIWNNEQDELRRRSIEIEENLKRKELTWQEQVEGKAKLLALMESIYGRANTGRPAAGSIPGFGVNKLAAMLGETPAQTSKDLRVAEMVRLVPSLATSPTKESAFRTLSITASIAQMQRGAPKIVPGATMKPKLWTLYEGDFNASVAGIKDGTVDLLYTDLPFGVDLSKMSSHSMGVVGYSDTRQEIVSSLTTISIQSFRILHNDRYAVFFFGFNYYTELCEALRGAGFGISPVPVVWYKHTRSTENPNTRYANAYDPAIVAWKGSPVFMRPGQTNVIDILAVTQGTKLQIAQQPVELVERFILDMTAPGALVVDFCAGSGTTGVASVKNNRRVVLFEREPAACTIIKARLGAM